MAMLYCQKERIAEKGGVSLLPQPELQGGYIGALREVVVLKVCSNRGFPRRLHNSRIPTMKGVIS